MNITMTKTSLEKEFKVASKNIRQANKGLPWAVKINRDYELIFNEESAAMLTMRISYLDGDCKYQMYNIAL